MKKLESGEFDLVVGTSASVRGIDLPSLLMCCILGSPSESREYLHLAGRLARQPGQKGIAVSLVTDLEAQRQLSRHASAYNIDFNYWHWPEISPSSSKKEALKIMKDNKDISHIINELKYLMNETTQLNKIDFTAQELNEYEAFKISGKILNELKKEKKVGKLEKKTEAAKNVLSKMVTGRYKKINTTSKYNNIPNL